MFQKCFTNVLRLFLGCFEVDSWLTYGCLNGVSMLLQMCFMGVLRVFIGNLGLSKASYL